MNKHQTPNRKQRRAKAPSNIYDSLNIELRTIEPKTENQAAAFEGFESGKCMLLLGSAGTGKSYLAMYHALKSIQEGKTKRVVIMRTAVPTKDIGFLPGSEEDKANVYKEPYVQIVNELFGRGDAWGILEKHGIVEFRLTSFIRGITIDDSTVIFDECQSASLNELISVITRAGKNTVVHFVGDYAQSDLTKKSDRVLDKFVAILNIMKEFNCIYFNINDVVRSGLARSFLIAQNRIYGDDIII